MIGGWLTFASRYLGRGSVQRVRWLANAALCRYDTSLGAELGTPVQVRTEDGRVLDMDGSVVEQLEHDASVFVLFKRDLEGESEAGQQQA